MLYKADFRKMNNENTKMNCPKCGAEPSIKQKGHPTRTYWFCGSYQYTDPFGNHPLVASALCREREAHNETKRELAKWQSLAAQYAQEREHNALMAEMWRSVAAEFRGAVYYQFGNLPMAWPYRIAKAMKAYEEAVK